MATPQACRSSLTMARGKAEVTNQIRKRGRGRVPLVALLILLFAGLVTDSADAVTSTNINNIPVLDTFNRSEIPLSNGGKWAPLQWATNPGYTSTTGNPGWIPYNGYPTINGAYWTPAKFGSGVGDAAAMTMSTAPGAANRYLALWLNMSNPGSEKSGYQLKWVEISSGTYTVTLAKWIGGSETVLKTSSPVVAPAGTTFAISSENGEVTAWDGSGGSLTPLFSAADGTFVSGYAGMEGSGSGSRSANFKAGAVGPVESEILAMSVLDSLRREENPLSNGGKWTAMSWAGATPKAGYTTLSGWSSLSGYPDIAGAYWNPTLGTDVASSTVEGGDVAEAVMSQAPTEEGRYGSLWLNMPNPSHEKTGYQFKWVQQAGSKMEVSIAKWASGTQTYLATKSSVTIPTGSTLAVSDENGVIRAWLIEGTSLRLLLSATDKTYSGGYAGISSSGSASHLQDFKAGTLPGSPKLEALPILDSLHRATTEDPLSNGGQWLKTGWSNNSGRIFQFTCCGSSGEDWGTAFNTALSGAYWTPSSFSESSNGDAVSIEEQILSHWAAYQSIWLNMPTPGGAKSGYEVRWTETHESGGDGHTVLTLSKWSSGVQTILSSANIKEVNRIALAKKGGIVSVWVGSAFDYGDIKFRPQLVAIDGSYASGWAGMEEPGLNGEGGLANFAAGNLG